MPTNRIFAIACVALVACGPSAPKEIPSKSERLEGFDVDVDVRSATLQNGNIVIEALGKNGEPKSLIDLHVVLSVQSQSGAELRKIDVDAVGMHGTLGVLEPGFDVPIHVREKIDGVPAQIVARVTRAERFADDPDAPQPLTVRSVNGADTSGIEVVTFGHFRLDSGGDSGSLPFHAMLGIRNTGKATVKRLDYGIAFTDVKDRDVDRIPIVHVFEPPLKPGDAILEPVSGMARPYAKLSIDVRSITKAE